MKKILLLLTLALCAPMTFAQNIPSYVPTNGLVGYWSFNGNANDQSGNGNNGTVNGCLPINDRNGNPNSAYQFGGTRNVSVPMTLQIYDLPQRTFSCWFKANGSQNGGRLFETTFKNGGIALYNGNVFDTFYGYSQHCCGMVGLNGGDLDQWHHLVSNTDDLTGLATVYLDGVLIASSNGNPAGGGCIINSNWQGEFIRFGLGASGESFNGDIDDIAIYNRTLTQEEITNLYQGCALSITTQPTNQTTNISNNAQFTVESSNPDATYQWQTDLGVGFQNISNAGQYTGATTSALTISNTTLSNNNQLFRCVIAKASCTDTSTVATLTVNEAIPFNVPTDGLVGYWPFNGNANDESGNGNNGTVNGATLTTDRFGNSNGAYSFDGNDNYISVPNIAAIGNTSRTFSAWVNLNNIDYSCLISTGTAVPNSTFNLRFYLGKMNIMGWGNDYDSNASISISNPTWYYCTVTFDTINLKFYLNGQLYSSDLASFNTFGQNNYFGKSNHINNEWYLNGSLDDIAIWNRALTQEEITQLYYADNTCQSLVINTGVLSFNPPTYNNTVRIYPNPANDHITIDCGNLANVSGWSIKIFNTLGQEVFSGAMNTQQYVVPLNSWSGQGVYFVKIYDASGNLMNTKKIILQ
jgi:hypothetical protein